MSDASVELATRVAELEAKVELLIQNLQANNSDLYQLIDELLALTNAPAEIVQGLSQRLKKAIGERTPPGCRTGAQQP